MGKDKAMIQFLSKCPTIIENPLFFNFANEEVGNNHFITESDSVKHRYIDGSLQKQYTFSIANYSSVSHNALLKDGDTFDVEGDENVENMSKVQEILDWINEQADIHNFPDFGPNCEIDSMETLTADPNIDGIDTSVNPPIARYSVGVKLLYLDKSKIIWS